MHRLLFLLSPVVVAFAANAASSAMFSAGRVVIVIQGRAGDLDAPNLFNAMTTAALDDGGKLKKQVSVNSSTMVNLFNLSCNVSKTIANFGSCTLQIPKSAWASIDGKNHFALLGINDDSDAWLAAKNFVTADPSTNEIYRSIDGRVVVSAIKDEQNRVISFSMSYRE